MADPLDAELMFHGTRGIIVQFDEGAPESLRAQALSLAAGDGPPGLAVALDHSAPGLTRLELGAGADVQQTLDRLSHLPGVRFAEPDYVVSATAVSNDPGYTGGKTWGLYGDLTTPANAYGSQAGEAWAAGYTGSTKVAVGVIDTGVDYTHPDLYQNIWLNNAEIPTALNGVLKDTDADGRITFRDLNATANASYVSDANGNGRIDAGDILHDARWADGADQDGNGYTDDLVGWDFVNNDNDPMDDAGHGTHVSGTIGAAGGNGTGVAGLNWAAQIIPLKFLDSSGSGLTSDAVRAADYFTNASKAAGGLDFAATNNSWGGGGASQALTDAVTRGAAKDILFVAAAGNGGSDQVGDNNDTTPNYPSNISTVAGAGYEAVVSVASITSAGKLSAFSNYGQTSVDLGAPGSSIYSTTMGGGYGYMSGTSMATPHVTGAIALYSAAAGPGLSAAQIRADLLGATTPTASLAGLTVTGGRLDVAALLGKLGGAAANEIDGTAGADTLTGSAGGDLIDGGASGDSLAGLGGSDTLAGGDGADTLDGGTGADRLDGGAGSDHYYVDSTGDQVVETVAGSAGGGADLVASSVSFTLGSNVERLTLTGSAALDGTGNSLGNLITGNSGANHLSGLAGADNLRGGGGTDTLDGGAGADQLSGGSGDDVFVFARGQADGDTVKDFAAGDHLQFTGYSSGSTLAQVAGSTTDWLVTDHTSGATELIHLTNGYHLTSSDYIFG